MMQEVLGNRPETLKENHRAYVILVKRDPLPGSQLQFFMAKINHKDGQWTFPGGGKEINEVDPKATAVRELFEESNMHVGADDLEEALSAPFKVNQQGIQRLHLFYATNFSGTPTIKPGRKELKEMSELGYKTISEIGKMVVEKQIMLHTYIIPAIGIVLAKLQESGFISQDELEEYNEILGSMSTRRGRMITE